MAKTNSAEEDRKDEIICGTKWKENYVIGKNVQKFIDAFRSFHSIKVCSAGHLRVENCRNCKLHNPLRINPSNQDTENGQETHESPTITVHGIDFLRPPLAEATLFKWKFFGLHYLIDQSFSLLNSLRFSLKHTKYLFVSFRQSNQTN